MRILLTGASSFTGMWFAETLAAAGQEVVAPLRRPIDDYSGVRRERVDRVARSCDVREGVEFGGEAFLELVRGFRPDRFCHHAARVEGYREPDFDVAAAIAENTRGLDSLFRALADAGCGRFVVTGSVFEPGEGAGTEGLRSFSGYGLSKALTAQIAAHYAALRAVPFGKFVIPNPFGPLEEPRFTAYLMKTWLAGAVAEVRTPAYVRDNIHVALLAGAYRDFVLAAGETSERRLNPSGYRESQGAFTERVAAAMRDRLGLPCAVALRDQTDFAEPLERVNTDSPAVAGFVESDAWDAFASWYLRRHDAAGRRA